MWVFIVTAALRPRPNVELLVRRTKFSELSSRNVRRPALQLLKFVCMSLDRPTRNRRIERVKIVSGTILSIFTYDELHL